MHKFSVPQNWKSNPTITRCIKFKFHPNKQQEKQLLRLRKNIIKCTNEISSDFVNHFKLIIATKDKGWDAIKNEYMKKYLPVMHKHNIHYSRLREGIMSNIIERYKGFKKRFKKCPKKPIILKENKAIYIEYGEFIRNDEKQTFKITLDGKPSYNKIDVPYQIVFGQERLMYSKVNAAGYLSFRKNCWIFTVAAKNIPIKWKYKPIQAECRDSGRNPWQARPNGQKIQIPKEIEDVCNQIKELNQLIPVGNKQKILEEQGIEINSGYRQKLRRKWLKAHRQLDNLTRKYAQQEVNEAVKNRAVIGIDGVAVGVSTWGQDHYYKWLMTLAQNQSIPHLLINPAYSSRTCNDCGYRNPKKNRKSVDILYCEKCNKEKDAQINAAKNMTQQTWKIWKSLS